MKLIEYGISLIMAWTNLAWFKLPLVQSAMLILIFKVIDHHLYIFKTTITSMQQIQGKLPKGRASSKAYQIK